MNIMLVSVTERTREIGLRLAVGARGKDIMTQFLVEAMTLSTIGGGVGVLLGIGISYLVAWLANWEYQFIHPIDTISRRIFGNHWHLFWLLPSQKAAHMQPITALRYE
jgi:putative ABC transport system permease protein